MWRSPGTCGCVVSYLVVVYEERWELRRTRYVRVVSGHWEDARVWGQMVIGDDDRISRSSETYGRPSVMPRGSSSTTKPAHWRATPRNRGSFVPAGTRNAAESLSLEFNLGSRECRGGTRQVALTRIPVVVCAIPKSFHSREARQTNRIVHCTVH